MMPRGWAQPRDNGTSDVTVSGPAIIQLSEGADPGPLPRGEFSTPGQYVTRKKCPACHKYWSGYGYTRCCCAFCGEVSRESGRDLKCELEVGRWVQIRRWRWLPRAMVWEPKPKRQTPGE